MVTKINVSLPQELLKELDRVARESHSSRSGFIAEAIRCRLAQKEEELKLQRRRRAAEKIIKLADEIGPWDGTAEILKWRQRH